MGESVCSFQRKSMDHRMCDLNMLDCTSQILFPWYKEKVALETILLAQARYMRSSTFVDLCTVT